MIISDAVIAKRKGTHMKKGNENVFTDELTKREVMVMKCIWESEGPISAVQIQKELMETYEIWYERSTIATFLLHLREKEYIDTYKKGQVYYYTPLVSKDDYIRTQTRQYTDFWFKGSVAGYIRAYVGGEKGAISAEEIAEIKAVLKEI